MTAPPSIDSRLAVLPHLADLRVLVLGDVMLDIFDFCREEESKPIDSEKPGKRAYFAHESVIALGGAGNVAGNVAALGAPVSLIGLAGNDGHRHTLRELCSNSGIGHCLVRDARRPTTTKTRLYIDGNYILRKDHESARSIDHETAVTLINEVAIHIAEGVDAVVLSDYAKGVFTAEVAERVLALCRQRSVPVVIDFKPNNRALFEGAGLLVPNETEASALLPGFREIAKLDEAVADLAATMKTDRIGVTLGARGICGLDRECGFFHVPGHRVEAVDAVGCGDTVRAVLALGLAAGLPLPEAAALANDAAAVIVQKAATASLTRDELEAFIRGLP